MTENVESLYERIGGQAGLDHLLRHFYADVRQHHLIGPIFNREIPDWPAHLAKIGQFWARVLGGPSNYSGQMPAKHFPLELGFQHFGAWLTLWDANCRCHLRPQEAGEMSQLAHDIGDRLKGMIANEQGARGKSGVKQTPMM